MAVRLGTVAAIGFDDFPTAEWLGCFRQLGCQAVQAYRNHAADVPISQMKDAIAAGGMPCDSLHGLYGEQYDPSAPTEAARRSAVDAFKREGDLALALGGPMVVVHCATIRPDGIDERERACRLAQLRKSIEELGRFGRSMGVWYAFENLPGYHAIGHDVGELADLLTAAAAPNTGMCYDTGHAHMVGDAAALIDRAGGQIIYVHLSDNSGREDGHDMPTLGTMDVPAVADAIARSPYNGTVMLEVFYDVDRLKRLLDDGIADRLAEFLRLANEKK